jgi:hypothetical protein
MSHRSLPLVAALCLGVTVAGCASASQVHASKQPTNRLYALARGVKSIRLHIGTPAGVERWCRTAARDLHRTVACPRIVPDAPLASVAGVTGLLEPPSVRGMYGLVFNTGGDDPTSAMSIHWVVGEGTILALRRYILRLPSGRHPAFAPMVARRRVGGLVAMIYRFPDYPQGGAFGGHTVAIVRRREHAYYASVHGYQHVDASVALAVGLALVGANTG